MRKTEMYRVGPFTWSRIELNDLVKSWLAISVAFAIVLQGFSISPSFLLMIMISGLTVGLGFIVHEMGHKLVAQRYGVWAEFRANYPMLLLAIAMSFFGFVFAAPGAVVMRSHVSRGVHGRIAIAGPVMNIVIALLFLMLSFVSANIVVVYGFIINSWLALFNLIPFGFFDGSKILAWNRKYYGVAVAVAVILVFVSSGGLA